METTSKRNVVSGRDRNDIWNDTLSLEKTEMVFEMTLKQKRIQE